MVTAQHQQVLAGLSYARAALHVQRNLQSAIGTVYTRLNNAATKAVQTVPDDKRFDKIARTRITMTRPRIRCRTQTGRVVNGA